MSKRISALVMVLALTACFTSCLAEAGDDWQYWSAYNLKHKINESWSVFLNPELRIRDDISQLSFWRSRQGVIYSFNKNFAVGQNYLYARKKSAANQLTSEQGFESDLFLKWSWKELGFSNRMRLEHLDIEFETKYRYRNQFKVDKNVRIFKQPVKIYVFDEIFYDEEDNRFTQNRAALGFVKALNEAVSLDVAWWYKTDRTGDNFQGTNILRTSLSISF